MADVLSIVGIGLGVASLIFQITDECIKRYKYFAEAGNVPESYRYLTIRLQMEQQRFLNFALEAGLLYQEEKLCRALQVNHVILQSVLTEMKREFDKYEEKNGKYVEYSSQQPAIDWSDEGEPRMNLLDLLTLSENDTSTTASDSQIPRQKGLLAMRTQAAHSMKKLRKIFTDTKRIVWVAVDRENFEELVERLTNLNTFLVCLLDKSQAKQLEKRVEASYQAVLQVQNDVGDLKMLVQALDLGRKGPSLQAASDEKDDLPNAVTVETRSNEEMLRHLQELTKVKIRRIKVDLGQKTFQAKDPAPWIHNDGPDTLRHQCSRKLLCRRDRLVWLEWLDLGALYQSTDKSFATECRVSLLTDLLREEKLPAAFLAPPCLGYARIKHDYGQVAYALVFERYAKDEPAATLANLRELLFERPKPSMTARMALASALANCVYNFHAVGWLHKGIRSENVLFFTSNMEQLDVAVPYLTGFDLSRPDDVQELTGSGSQDAREELYRHPRAQLSELKGRYRRSYDIYSLGVVLLEVAYWRPIEEILGHGDVSAILPSELQGIQSQILGDWGTVESKNGEDPGDGSRFLSKAAAKCGDAYRDAVATCLSADQAERPSYKGESAAAINNRLQMMLDEQVVSKLRGMREAMVVGV